MAANQSSTGLGTFRAIVKKYPGCEPRKVLSDLAAWSGESGRWFVAAKDAGCFDLALEFARSGRTDPRTLSRASRDSLGEDTQFSLEAGRLAIQFILGGYGYELTGMDMMDAYQYFMAAAHALGIGSQARAEVFAIAAERPGIFSDILVRLCSAASQRD